MFKQAKKEAAEEKELARLEASERRDKAAGEKGKKYEEKIKKIMAAKRKRDAEENQDGSGKMAFTPAKNEGK